MKKTIVNIILIVSILVSCNEKSKTKEILVPEFQSIMNSSNVNGSILIYDLQKDLFYSNNFDWAKIGQLPASTFKIPNSIIALETKVVKNDSTLFKWNGEKRAYKIWEQDLILRDAFQYSCVPCYQEIANKIGEKRMNEYLEKLQFGDMNVTSKNLDVFWLEGASKINQFQQIDFLKRLVNSELKISKTTEEVLRKISFIEKNERYKLYGKTGLSIRNGNNNGWFVGYIKMKNKTYFFATNIEPNENTNKKLFPKLRKEITIKALDYMK
ncbi:class D beta-lactamase [Polaribacter reichenbachii]|uniref:Beta-lactamase n=1 Tax=Polaribacter reichenbachii TaxID=996801 RepID=A0A1B8U4A0_9FLAO|nr:class D beta-lactamase [Polaribacter reichenbachii]APZ47420.1 class D beta-lactamase [Polaribacter reichenbachii]AUC18059.1 class D beta-lactamase [Polaribacter reichenbachii]OBY66669.1 class D beta-lactamase [Polaribacter reichenbachii]